MNKVCNKCGVSKDTDDFTVERAKCRMCVNEENRIAQRRAQFTDEEVRMEKARIAEISLRKYHKNKDKVLLRLKEQRLANPAISRASGKRSYDKSRAYVDAIKANPCSDCGRTFPPCAMDFDHVKGEKRKDVSHLLKNGLRTVIEELAKCELVCACCHRVRSRNHNWKRKGREPTIGEINQKARKKVFKDRVSALKAGKPCADCSETYPPVAMDFDHVRGEKMGSVSQLAARMHPWEHILAEISKCELVCINCHRVRTQSRQKAKKAA